MAQFDANARIQEAMHHHKQGRYDEAEAIYRELLKTLPQSALVHNMMGVLEGQRKNYREAIRWLQGAIQINENIPDFYDNLGAALISAGKIADARRQFHRALALQPGRDSARTQLARSLMPGGAYTELIERLLRWRTPKVYLEIGIRQGRTLALAKPPTLAIGVEKKPDIRYRFEAPTRIYEVDPLEFLGSDRIAKLAGRNRFDIAMIRSPRSFEEAYDTFVALEAISGKDSILMLHGTLAPDPVAGARERNSNFWVGDLWKLVPCLLEKRPELGIFTVPVFPVGITIVAGLKKRNTRLARNRDANIAEFIDRELPEPDEWKSVFNLGSENWAAIRQRLARARG
jgi:hypothetical protein